MKNMWWCGFLLCFIIEEMEKKTHKSAYLTISIMEHSRSFLCCLPVVVLFWGVIFACLFKCWGVRDTEDKFSRKNMLTYILIITESRAAMSELESSLIKFTNMPLLPLATSFPITSGFASAPIAGSALQADTMALISPT